MDIFIAGLCTLSVICLILYKRSNAPTCNDPQFNKFKFSYLLVYLLATGKKWAWLTDTLILPLAFLNCTKSSQVKSKRSGH